MGRYAYDIIHKHVNACLWHQNNTTQDKLTTQCVQGRLCAREFLLRNPRNTTKTQNTKSNILTCFLDIQKHKPRLHKHIINITTRK